MRIVFMGTPQIAATCLQRLLDDGHELSAAYTKPDTPQNRGMKLTCSAVKELAASRGLTVVQPTTFRDDSAVEQLRAFAPELIVVVAYGKLLPQRVLDIPPLGCINIHASLLPALRGAAPIQRAILNGLDETGVTAMYLSAGMDEGDMIASRATPIDPEETSGELTERLAVLGAALLGDTVRAIAAGTAGRVPQNPKEATYAAMLTKQESPVDWNRTQRQILDQIRGLLPWPVASMELEGKRVRLYKAQSAGEKTGAAPGTVLSAGQDGLKVACGDGVLRITELQADGGKRMRAADYFRGHPLKR